MLELLEKLSNPEIFLDVINGFVLNIAIFLIILFCLENLARLRYWVNFQEKTNKIIHILIIPLSIFFVIIFIMTIDFLFLFYGVVVLGFLILNFLIQKDKIKNIERNKRRESTIRFIYFSSYFASQFAMFHFSYIIYPAFGSILLFIVVLNLILFIVYLKSFEKPLKFELKEENNN